MNSAQKKIKGQVLDTLNQVDDLLLLIIEKTSLRGDKMENFLEGFEHIRWELCELRGLISEL